MADTPSVRAEFQALDDRWVVTCTFGGGPTPSLIEETVALAERVLTDDAFEGIHRDLAAALANVGEVREFSNREDTDLPDAVEAILDVVRRDIA